MEFIDSQWDKIVIALLIFSFFQFFKAFLRRLVYGLLSKLVKRTRTTLDDEILEVLKKPVNFLFIAIGAKLAVSVLVLPESFETVFQDIIVTMFNFSIFWGFYNITQPLSRVIYKLSAKLDQKLSQDVTNFIVKSIRFFIIIVGLASILQQWGINVTGFVASLGLVGMAFALAAKDTAANLFGSLVIFSDRPFEVDDWIKTPDVEGIVESIGIRSTRVRTFAQGLVSVPNAVLANSAILNWSRMGKRRIYMQIGVTYSTTAMQMQTIVSEIRAMLQAHHDIHQETILIYFSEFADSSLSIFCYYFTKTTQWTEYMRVKEDTNFKIMEIVERNGADFAFPSRSLYIENQKAIAPQYQEKSQTIQ